MSTPLTQHRIRRTAAEVLGTDLRSYDDVIDAVLDATGVADGPDRDEHEARVEHELFDSGEFVEVGDHLGHLPSLLDGTRWVCAISDDVAASGALPASALPFISFLVLDRPLTLHDIEGDALGEIVDEELDIGDDIDHLVGPDGWLRDAGGRYVEFDFGADATVRLTALDEPPALDPGIVSAFRSSYQAAIGDPDDDAATVPTDDGTGELEFAVGSDVARRMIGRHREALVEAPVPPFASLAEGCGFEVERGLVAPRGFDWDALHAWQGQKQLEWLWRLDPNDAEFLQVLLGASFASMDDDSGDAFGDDEEHVAAMSLFGVALERPGVAEAFWGEHARRETGPDDVLRFVRGIIDCGDDGSFGGARWVAARCLDHLGRPLEAEKMLEESVGGEMPDHPAAMEMLATLRSDRGDAAGAVAMLQRTDMFDVDDPDDLVENPFLHELVQFATNRPKPAAGRNDPCPCGSGKKYKRCHLGHERHPLDDRVNWLFDKMARFVRDNRFATRAEDLAEVVAQASGTFPRLQVLNAPWLADLVLVSCGAGTAFANERSSLLPDDEARLATRWTMIEPSVFEVRSVHDDALALTDLRSGDHVTVVNLTPSERTRPGTVLYGRPVPVGDTWRALSGFIGVPSHQVEPMMAAIDAGVAGDPEELATRIGATFAPPTLTNTSGESTRFHTQTWSVADVDEAGPALIAAGMVDEGDGRFSLVRDTDANANTVIASMRLDEDTLTVECNSDERVAEVTELLTVEVDGIALVDNDYFETEEMMHRAAGGEGADAGVISLKAAQLDDPELRELIMAEVARHESEWLDASIPALDGRTPRDCAADPVGREQLLRLLATFPETDELTEMSPARLRSALGL